MLRKILSLLILPVIIVAEIAAWFYIDISFDGCCGAPINYSNDKLQSLVHLSTYALGIVVILLVLRWGWKKEFSSRS